MLRMTAMVRAGVHPPPESSRAIADYGRFRVCILLLGLAAGLNGADNKSAVANSGTTLVQLVSAIRGKARALETSEGTKSAFNSFTAKFKLQAGIVTLSDYVVARLFFEATRDAGFWNLHWAVTDQPPNSDNIWRQWRMLSAPSSSSPTATAECDELSALYAFLVERAGVRSVGLFWPAANHTVAVWVLHQPNLFVRVVIPTTQIFLDEDDYWGTRKFDPWQQKVIYEYTRRDVPDTFELPQSLFDFFLRQADKYASASDTTLQLIRYWREAVFQKSWSHEAAAREAMRVRRNRASGSPEDLAALQNFAQDMQALPADR